MATRTKKIQPTTTSPSPPRDPVTQYASDAVAGKIVVGPLVRKACQRHLRDLKRLIPLGYRWDLDAALRAINFFPDVLCLPESDGVPFILQPAQEFIVGSLFGWKAPDGFRRFRTAYVEQGKGNGKSPLAGGIGLYMMCADGEVGAYCYAAANTREQADILFQDAVKMVDASPRLSKRIVKSGKMKVLNLAYLPTGSFFRPVSAEHKGLDGKRIHFAALDEVHESSAIVVNKVRAGTKGRRQALIFEITNSGFDRESVCFKHHEYGRQIVEGVLEDESWLVYICSLEPCPECLKAGKTQPDSSCTKCDDWRDPKCWPKVNPLLGVSVTHKYLEQQVREAMGMPSQENIVKRLNFCIWTEGDKRWLPVELWEACKYLHVDEQELLGQTCYGALDLALTCDLSAFVLAFPPLGERKHWVFLAYFWIPEADMLERVDKDHVPYDVWRDHGKVAVTPGNVTDHDFIETQILELSKKFNIAELAFDPSRAVQLVTHLQAAELNLVEFPQTCRMFNAGVLMMEKMFKEGLFGHGNHPVLAWNFSNAVTISNSAGEVKFDKGKKTGRIDGMVAAAMAVGRAMNYIEEPKGSIFDGDDWKKFYN